MNKDSPIGSLFPPVPRYDKHFIDTRTWPKVTNYELSSYIEIFFNSLKQFPFKYCSNKWWKLLESFKKRRLELLGHQAQNYNLLISKKDQRGTVLPKVYVKSDKQINHHNM